jgi:hypothetical protein
MFVRSHSEDDTTEGNKPLVPTLHVLFSRPHSYVSPLNGVSPPSVQLRDELINWIADEALGGDRDAAEWILLAAVAQV